MEKVNRSFLKINQYWIKGCQAKDCRIFRLLFTGQTKNCRIFLHFGFKLGCVVRLVIDSILPHAKCGPNHHRKDAPPFTQERFTDFDILFSRLAIVQDLCSDLLGRISKNRKSAKYSGCQPHTKCRNNRFSYNYSH